MAVQHQALTETHVDGSQVLVGVFNDQLSAERARASLQSAGIVADNINVLSKRPTGGITGSLSRQLANDDGQSAARVNLGTGVGVVAGGVAGATALLSIEFFPGLASALEGSRIVLIAVGAVIGMVLGGWGGTMIGQDVPEEDLSYFTGDLDEGKHLVAVRTNRIDEALDLLRDAGAHNLDEGHSH